MVLPFVVGTLGVVVLMPLSSAMDDGEFNSGCGLRRWWWRRGQWTMKTAFNGSGGRGGGVQWLRQHSTETAVGVTDTR